MSTVIHSQRRDFLIFYVLLVVSCLIFILKYLSFACSRRQLYSDIRSPKKLLITIPRGRKLLLGIFLPFVLQSISFLHSQSHLNTIFARNGELFMMTYIPWSTNYLIISIIVQIIVDLLPAVVQCLHFQCLQFRHSWNPVPIPEKHPHLSSSITTGIFLRNFFLTRSIWKFGQMLSTRKASTTNSHLFAMRILA
jgi:hypothetical protein